MKDKLLEFFKKHKIPVIVASVVIVALVVVIAVLLSRGKNSNAGEGESETSSQSGSNTEYTLYVSSKGGMAFSKVNVYVYNGDADDDLINAGKTDEDGKFVFSTDVAVEDLGFTIQGLPESGYELKDIYKVSKQDKNNLYIYLDTKIEELEDFSNTTFDEGSIIKDFSVTTPDGEVVQISKLLDEKEIVVLNFFYLNCQPCKSEMPYLEEAYKAYGDKIALIAMTPIDKDDAKIKEYIDELGLTFYVAQCPSEWETMMGLAAYPTTVIIDKWGMISYIHEGMVTESGVFEAIFDYFINSDKQHIVKHLDDIISAEAEEGTEGNPIEILPDSTEFEAKVPANSEVYFEIPKVSNMIMEITDADAYIIYEDEKYEAVDGVVSVIISAPDPYTPAKFVIGNAGSSDKTFTAKLTAVKGTVMNPYELQIGEFTVNVNAGNEQGVYHTFTATENGTLTCKSEIVEDGVKYDVVLYNLNTYVNKALSADANADGTVSVVVDAGNVVQIIVSTVPNENNEYPAATINGELSFESGEGTGKPENNDEIQYSVVIKDADGKPLSGIDVMFDTKVSVTDSNGKAVALLAPGSYSLGITVPEGLKLQGEVIVTEDAPDASVTLVSTTAKQISYTVKVTDASGKAISGATVIVGNSVVSTNSSGVATVTLAEGTYDVTASASGYKPNSGSVSKTSTSITIKLEKNSSSSTNTDITYTVNAVDYKGSGIKGVTVIFKSNGKAVATSTTDNSGKATAKLAKGNYEVTLALDGYGYEKSNAKVTSSSTSVNILMATVSTGSEDVFFDNTGAYKVAVGAKYVEIPSEDTKNSEYGGNAFFLFTPTKAGMYKIELSNPAALISYWGGSTSYVNNATYDVTHTNTSITINVAEKGPTLVFGIKDVSDCIVTVTRTGNAIVEMAWTDYEGTDTIKPYTFGGGTLTYVDITKSGDNPYNLVYNSTDGYYHVGSANGPVMLVQLGAGAPHIALSDVIGYTGHGGSNFGRYFYDKNGNLTKKENYTSLLWEYMENMDETKGLYPLTKDLEYILKNGGEHRGWWATSGYGNTIYSAVPKLNSKIAWMWACCYVE